MREPRPHQGEALEYGSTQTDPALIMEMRLGKTMVIIRWAKEQDPPIRTAGVTVPLTVMEAWKNELTLEGEAYLDLNDVKKDSREKVLREEALKSDHRVWVLVSHQTAQSVGGIDTYPWDLFVLDESVRAKNPKAALTKYLTKGFRTCLHRAILSGLPNPESELELFCQFQFLDGHFMGFRNYWHFKNALFRPAPWSGHEWLPKKGARKRIKEYLHERAFVLTRSEVRKNYKVYSQRHVDMTPKQRKLYKEIVKDYAYQDQDGEWHETQWAMTASAWLQRIAGGFSPDGKEVLSEAKAKEVVTILEELPRGSQMLVWFKFRAELALVEEHLQRKGFTTGLVHGGIPKAERERVLGDFRRKKIQVFLATEKCAKMGVDCSTADCAVYYSNEWSYDDRAQSEDRIENFTKKVPLLIIDLVTRGTVDTKVVSRIRDKGFNAREILIKYFDEVRRAS